LDGILGAGSNGIGLLNADPALKNTITIPSQ